MARTCNVCQKTIPDDLESCPHCQANADDVMEVDWAAIDEAESDIIDIAPNILEHDGGSEVDLGSGPHRAADPADESESSSNNLAVPTPAAPAASLPQNEEDSIDGTTTPFAEAEEAAEVAARDDLQAELDEPALAAAKARKTGTAGAWLGGGAIGLLIGAAACAGFWFTGIPDQWRDKSPAKAAAPSSSDPRSQPPAKESALVLLDRGDYAGVLAEVPQGDHQEPEVARAWAVFGEAKWRSVMEQQSAKPLPWKAPDPAIDEAKSALQKAGTPEALFWLGHIQECTGDIKGARQIYEDGKKKFPKERLFATALQRLDVLADEAPGPGDRAPEENTGRNYRADFKKPVRNQREAVQWFMAREDNVPMAANPNPNRLEAGDHFWEAVHFAKNGKYDEAVNFLDRALLVHKSQRFIRQNKNQNPRSDPAEEIFIKTCQELEMYWKLRKQLQSAGYLDGHIVKNPARAMAIAIAKANEKKSEDNMRVLLDKLKKDKDIAALDPAPKDVAKGIDALLEAKRKSLAQLADVQKTLEEKLKDADVQLKTADEKSKELALQLKSKDDQIKESTGHAKLAEETLKEVAAKLAQANLVGPDARGEKLIQGAERAAKWALRQPVAPRSPAEAPAIDSPPKANKQPDVPGAEVSSSNDPIRAETIFALGVANYSDRKYATAERAFQNAIRVAGAAAPDARHYYFLGLAQLALGDPTNAETSFKQAVRLERDNKPASPAVSTSLERIQGRPRQILDGYRR